MLFGTFDFLLFFAALFLVYWALAGQPRWRALAVIAASYFFYMAGPKPAAGPLSTPWYFAGLLVVSTLVNYGCALGIARAQERARGWELLSSESKALAPSPGRTWLLASLLVNLGLLGYFKYSGFASELISDAAALLGTEVGVSSLKLLLPIGISFYTFQGISYTVDVYRGRLAAERNLPSFALFLSFFPQLVAGPIVRAGAFLPQLHQRPRLTTADVDFAIFRIAKGLVKKILFADFIAASFTDRVFASPAEHSSLENLLALYAFTLQIYADFSGYSDIAIGAARLLGFRLPENFDRPYQAVDVADFWRRWHITLSTWLRDYVYYPLGGSRGSAARTYFNLWLTMFLVGLWHGASWNFVLYASLQAGAMVYNRACARQAASLSSSVARLASVSLVVLLGATSFGAFALELPNPWWFGVGSAGLALVIGLLPRCEQQPALRGVHVLLTLHFCVLSRVFFRADSLEAARVMLGKILDWDGLRVRTGLFGNEALSASLSEIPALRWAVPATDWVVLILLFAGFVLHYLPGRELDSGVFRWLPRVPGVVVGIGLAALLGGLSLVLAAPRANIYFAF